ncbi:MAG: major capsid protein [Oscillibacter ruminantium]|uniref:major capsid protein n=1 Tax=Oscillibacter ruminantium TaxID=1263547 RepID=UPI002B20DA13|nr:major capsid protein [Oscillibacter ruminantium]MEA5041371.1 major capsid protein [Oscillibacter ruminantium]
MAINTNIYEPRTMGKLITRMPPVHTFFRDTFFKNVRTFPTKSVDVDFKKGNRALAPFVHPKIGGKTVPNRGYQTKSYTPVLVAPNKITTVDDLLERSAGENPYSGRTPAERAVEKLADDFRELTEMIVRREEWMAATAIFTGQIPIIGEGLNEVIDFNFTNMETIVTAGLKWSGADADPLADLERWRKAVQKEGFVNCNICIMASDVSAAFVNNAKIQKLLDTKAYDLAAIKPRELPNGVTYIGTINKLGLDIYEYNEWYLDDWTNPEAPEQKPLVPDGTLALLSTAADYSIYYGAVTVLDDKSGNFVTVEGNRVPQTWIERRPDRRFLQINSHPLTVPHEVNSWFVAKVL